MSDIYRSPSPSVPGGASFNGAGPDGIEALFAAADAAGWGWTDALGDDESATWEWLESRVWRRRRVDGDTEWGLLLPALHDYRTGEYLRPATADELFRSKAVAETDGAAGVIEIDGRSVYVTE